MSVIQVYGSFELVEGTASASDWIVLHVERPGGLGPKNLNPAAKPKETTGSTISQFKVRRLGKHFEATLKIGQYFDTVSFPMALMFGAPVTTAAGDTGGFNHLWKPGGNTQKSGTFRWQRTKHNTTEWWQATGVRAKSVKLAKQANGQPMWEFGLVGKYATKITAPAAVPDLTAAYIQPADMPQQKITLGGVAWKLVKKMDFSVTNGLIPDWSVDETQEYNRLKLGDTEGSLDFEAFDDAYVGSLQEGQDSASRLLSQIVSTITDTSSTIQAGTDPAVYPKLTLTFPLPSVDDANPDDTVYEDEEKAKVSLSYSPAIASLCSIGLLNQLPAAWFVGH